MLGVLVFAAPATAGSGSELDGIIARAEQLRGLTATEPLAVSTVNAGGMQGEVTRELARERRPVADAAWDDALHLLGVLEDEQTLEAVERRALTGQVAGIYIPRNRRLYVLGAGGSAPRSVIAHEVVHALQDEHFQLTRGAFAPRPADRDGDARRAGARRGRRDRRAVALRLVALAARPRQRARAHAARDADADAAEVPAFLQHELVYPYTAGQAFVRALRARGGQRLVDRAFRNPPRTTAAVLDPARYLAGDPPPQAVRLPGARYRLATTFGAEDLVALTGQEGLARSWLGGPARRRRAGPRPAPGDAECGLRRPLR